MPIRRTLIATALTLITLIFIFSHSFSKHDLHEQLRQLAVGRRNYAYATFLGRQWNKNETSTDEDDVYYWQTRMLLWQMKHDPSTRSSNNYPFVVLVTEDVEQHKRDRLEYEGAIVKRVDKLQLVAKKTQGRWVDMMSKLRLFELVEYDRVLFFDSDHLLTRPVDEMFEDPAAQVQQNKGLLTGEAVREDEAPQPKSYVFAAITGGHRFNHPIPPPESDRLNAGCLLFQPSAELFNYYLSLMTPEAVKRWETYYNDQGLWNYAHRRSGNMPWKQLYWKHNINWATDRDYEAGFASLHIKYWGINKEDTRLQAFAYSKKLGMEKYWEEEDAKLQKARVKQP